MEETSLAFSVAGAEELSDQEEEDDRQRKAELHQLLTEQLQDDLLDDSVSTVTTEDGAADSTLLGDEVDMSLDHVISPHQSCDLLHNDGKDQSAVEDPYSAQHGTNMGSSSSEQVAPTGNNQVVVSGCGSGCGPAEISDVFSGTAQAYSMITSDPSSSQHPLRSPPTINHTHQEVAEGRDHLTEGRGQLEVLYGARCRQVAVLTQQLEEAREEGERQVRIVRHEKSQLEEQLCAGKESHAALESQIQSLTQQLQEATAAITNIRTDRETLCPMIHPTPASESGDVARRLVELSTEKEDIQYQLSCCQGQLETQIQRTESAEVKLCSVSEELSSMATEVTDLRSEVERLRSEREREREEADRDKREALEKCRVACLQLHEDSTERLREALATEKQELLQDQSQQIATLQLELSSAQEEYVKLCGEKDRLESAHKKILEQVNEEWQRKTEQLVQRAVGREREQQGVEVRAAVERAREEWRESLAQESRVSVEKALMSARQQWQTRLEAEIEGVRLQEVRRSEEAIAAALGSTRRQNTSQEQATQVSSSRQHSEAVLTASQVHAMLQDTMAGVKNDVRQMLQEVIRVAEERQQQAVVRTRLATAEEMKTHYLHCLHVMVNSQTTPSDSGCHGKEQTVVRTTGDRRAGVGMATSKTTGKVGIKESAVRRGRDYKSSTSSKKTSVTNKRSATVRGGQRPRNHT